MVTSLDRRGPPALCESFGFLLRESLNHGWLLPFPFPATRPLQGLSVQVKSNLSLGRCLLHKSQNTSLCFFFWLRRLHIISNSCFSPIPLSYAFSKRNDQKPQCPMHPNISKVGSSWDICATDACSNENPASFLCSKVQGFEEEQGPPGHRTGVQNTALPPFCHPSSPVRISHHLATVHVTPTASMTEITFPALILCAVPGHLCITLASQFPDVFSSTYFNHTLMNACSLY